MTADTIRGYRAALKLVIDAKGADARLDSVTVGDIRTIMDAQFSSGRSPRTRKYYLVTIRSFFAWSIDSDLLQGKNPAIKKIKVVVPKRPSTKPLDDDKIWRLIDACDRLRDKQPKRVEWTRKRAKALILGMCFTGFRVSDMVTLKKSEVRLDGRSREHLMIKTDRVIYTKFGEIALKALLELPPMYQDYFFWNGKSRVKSATQSARRTIYRVAKIAGITPDEIGGRGVHPHRFRASFARKVLAETGDIRLLQKLLGHAHVQTTEGSYEHENPQDIERCEAALARVEYRRDGTTGQVIEMPHRD